MFNFLNEKIIDNFLEPYKLYTIWLILILHLVYFVLYFKEDLIEVKYLNYLRTFVNMFICLFLIYRFHPFRKEILLKKYDESIIFNCALILFINEGFSNYVISNVKFKPFMN
jgi:hypothetical protein